MVPRGRTLGARNGPRAGAYREATPLPILAVDLRERITIDPAVRSGKPTIRGTRITVADVLEYLAGGMTVEEVLADFPDLTREDVLAALAFAAERERRLFATA